MGSLHFFLQISKKSANFAADFIKSHTIKLFIIMKTFLQYLGAMFVLAGVICLAVYFFANPTNALLVAAVALELVGLLGYIVINKFIQ